MEKKIISNKDEVKNLIYKLEEDKFIIMNKYSIIDNEYEQNISLIENWDGEPYRALISHFSGRKEELNSTDEITHVQDKNIWVIYEYDTLDEVKEAGWDFDNYDKLKHKSMLFYGNLVL